MYSQAQWVWTAAPVDGAPRNRTLCFRKQFRLDAPPKAARIDISADSRFVLYINGTRVGQGPARSWHHNKQYDQCEVSELLRADDNTLAIQVVHWGIGCGFDPGGSPGGLIAALHIDHSAEPLLVTDASWKVADHPGYKRQVPRLAWGQAYTEQYDARNVDGDWTGTDFDDGDWDSVFVRGPVGTAPWTSMTPRNIPLLFEQSLYPARVFDVTGVVPPRFAWQLDLHSIALELEDSPPRAYQLAGIIVTSLEASAAGMVTMIRMNTSFSLDAFGALRVNGRDITFDNDRATFDVQAGSNLIAVRIEGYYQAFPAWVFAGDVIEGFSPVATDAATPFAMWPSLNQEMTDAERALWDCAAPDAVAAAASGHLRIFQPAEVMTDVFALSNTRTTLPHSEARLVNPQAICSANAELATGHLPNDGDLEFLLDFGEEMVGLFEFALDAPEGAIIDINAFEAIDRHGRWAWTDNLNNTLRYTAREGWQSFHSTVRRGFRYVQVTVREASRPVRFKYVRCIKNTFPVEQHGAFACSDGNLNIIWDMGRRTTQLCMEDTFVDCPAYEQTFWVGDSRNESLAAYAAFGDTALVKRCLALAAESLFRSEIPEQCVPSELTNIIPNWSLLWLLACEELFLYEGDAEYLRKLYPAIKTTCDAFVNHCDDDGLMRYSAWNMLDWANMDTPPGGANANENAWLVRALRAVAGLASRLHEPGAQDYCAQADQIVAALNDKLWDDAKQAYRDSLHPDGTPSKVFSQQTQTVMFLCDCVPEQRRDHVVAYMKEVPADWVPIATPFMTWFSFEALARLDDHQTILDWTRGRWGQMARAGATTCWEHFGGSSGESFRWAPTRSWCHAWSAAPTYFLSRYQLGVEPLEAGFTRARIAPVPVDLVWATGRVPTPHGPIAVDWEVVGGTFNLRVVHPPEIQVETAVPQGLEAGTVEIIARPTLTVPD